MAAASIFNPFSLYLKKVTVIHEGFFTLGPLSLKIPAGSFLQIQGPNGSGKTTLLRALAGFSSLESGEIEWEDLETQRPFCLFFSHQLGLPSKITVAQHLKYWQKLYQAPSALQEGYLDVFGLQNLYDQPLSLLSQGEKQRLSLIRLAMTDAPVWLLDEPFTFLDEQVRQELLNILIIHKNQGGLVLFSTHYPLTLPGLKTLHLPSGEVR